MNRLGAGTSITAEADMALRLRLRQLGLRGTQARVAVLRKLATAEFPLTHAELIRGLPALASDRSTILRILQDFVERGLAKRMDLGDHAWRYELVLGGNSAPAKRAHPYLLCTYCGNISCLKNDEVILRFAESLGEIQEVLIRGRCEPCSTAALR
jgi:Fur family transcriptional regulator, ferric uptake regulator